MPEITTLLFGAIYFFFSFFNFKGFRNYFPIFFIVLFVLAGVLSLGAMVTISCCTCLIKPVLDKSEYDDIPCFPKLLSENKEFVLATVFTNEESRSGLRTWKLINVTMLGLVITVALPRLLGFSDALIPNVMACILCGALICEGHYLYCLYDTYADRIIRAAIKDKNLLQKFTAAGKKVQAEVTCRMS